MKQRLFALIRYAAFWLVFFFFARLWFLMNQCQASAGESFSGLTGTFLHGLKLDMSTTGYYMLLPVLLIIPSLYFRGDWYRIILKWYTIMLIIFSSLIMVADASLYTYWGFRMDYTPLFYLRTPGEAMASVNTLTAVLLFAAMIVTASVFIYLYTRFVDRYFARQERISYVIPGMLFMILLLGSLIIPIRGGFGIAPINAGTVYFSSRMFLNHAAVNAVWNVGTTAFTQKPVENPYRFMDEADAQSRFDSLEKQPQRNRKQVLNIRKPNILLIVLESFSGYLTGPLGGDSLVTPNLNRIAREGLLFTGFYASGTRTDKALPAILDGYPAQPAQSIIKEPKKTQTLKSLVRILADKGYATSFWYGGDINFANFKSFIIGSGFQNIVTKDDFDKEFYNSKWGVHDHVLFNSYDGYMKGVREPFFNVLLTLSSHEPFDVPMNRVFPGEGMMNDYRNSVFYTDSILGRFISISEKQEWWKNTLVILVADHGARTSTSIPAYDKAIFRIPMIWTGGALSARGARIEKLGSQADIAVTLLGQLDFQTELPFGKDLLDIGSRSFAFYTFNEGFGFVTDTSFVAFDQKVKRTVVSEGKSPVTAEENGKAYLQVLFGDYLKR